MSSVTRQMKRNQKRGRRKTMVELPLVKEVEDVLVEEDVMDQFGRRTGNTEMVEREVVTRDDGGAMLSLLSQVDWNVAEHKKIRRDLTKVMKGLRKWNFEHAKREACEGHITVEEGQLEKLYGFLVKDTPKDVKIFGLNTMITLDEFEDFYDARERDKKAKSEDASTEG